MSCLIPRNGTEHKNYLKMIGVFKVLTSDTLSPILNCTIGIECWSNKHISQTNFVMLLGNSYVDMMSNIKILE